MSPGAIRVPTRWRGPAESGNGGYTCGLVANAMGGGAAEVTLRSPPPLERDLSMEPKGDGRVIVRDGETLVAEGHSARVELEIPEAPSHERAAEASRLGYELWADRHPFPECVVCGPEREPGDGLRIFPGELAEAGIFASVWTPDPSVGGDDGVVRPEGVWAALDCPSSAPAREPGGPAAVLGRLRADIDGPVRVGEPHVIASWLLERAGRKTTTAAALFDSSGRLLGRAEAVWIELKE